MNEVIREFLLETHENLAQLDLDLVQLEKDPSGTETIARVFRTLVDLMKLWWQLVVRRAHLKGAR